MLVAPLRHQNLQVARIKPFDKLCVNPNGVIYRKTHHRVQSGRRKHITASRPNEVVFRRRGVAVCTIWR